MRAGIVLMVAAAGCVNPLTATYNNCTNFKDRSAAGADRTVIFGGDIGLSFSPRCMDIAVGQSVDFQGDFSVHPIAAGTGPTSTADGSPNNPITTPAPGATDMSFTFSTAGQYPFFCQQHVGGGMAGVIRVRQ